ncbi:hypothetical protein Thu_225 [Bacillus phage Thurquoise]|nr:hypothetical protein Thu_225 [Bacillus phage Thurquoise]
MKSSLFVPDKINVGYQERGGTYTGKLAYVIYFDQKGKLRKEVSWNSWRDQKIDNLITDNVPTSGFVLNKKAGDYKYDWNHRQAYARVYDPRGFEFEITIDNLLYILECCDMFKGKGIDGELVYAWEGKDLVLLPVNSPDYKEIMEYNKIIKENKTIKGKDLKLGYKYLDKDGKEWVYLGRFHKYDSYSGEKKKNKFYFFAKNYKYAWKEEIEWSIDTVSSLGQKFITESPDGCVDNYAELVEMLECDREYSPIDLSKDEYVPLTFEEFLQDLKDKEKSYDPLTGWFYSPILQRHLKSNDSYYSYYHRNDSVKVEPNKVKQLKEGASRWSNDYEWVQEYEDEEKTRPLFAVTNGENKHSYYSNYKEYFKGTLSEVFEYLKPATRHVYLENGKLYRKDR